MKTTLLSAFIAFCILLVSACAGGGRMVTGPGEKMYYELPQMRDAKDHCGGAEIFSVKIARWRFHQEFRDGKEFIIPVDKKSARKDLDDELANVENFTERGKRNYNKIINIFDRIITDDEFEGKTPEQVGKAIYVECIEKMANKTWMPGL